jgi:hypothetical protein
MEEEVSSDFLITVQFADRSYTVSKSRLIQLPYFAFIFDPRCASAHDKSTAMVTQEGRHVYIPMVDHDGVFGTLLIKKRLLQRTVVPFFDPNEADASPTNAWLSALVGRIHALAVPLGLVCPSPSDLNATSTTFKLLLHSDSAIKIVTNAPQQRLIYLPIPSRIHFFPSDDDEIIHNSVVDGKWVYRIIMSMNHETFRGDCIVERSKYDTPETQALERFINMLLKVVMTAVPSRHAFMFKRLLDSFSPDKSLKDCMDEVNIFIETVLAADAADGKLSDWPAGGKDSKAIIEIIARSIKDYYK